MSAPYLCVFMFGCAGVAAPPAQSHPLDDGLGKNTGETNKPDKRQTEEPVEPAPDPAPLAKEIGLESALPRVVVVLADGRVALVPLDVIKKHRTDAPATKTDAVSEDDGMITLATRGKGAVRMPLALVESFIDAEARPGHGMTAKGNRGGGRSKGLSASPIGGPGGADWGDSEASFHADYEYGECEYTDESGFVTQAEQWHNHPHSTEYTEILTP